jgi:hypothetical protein
MLALLAIEITRAILLLNAMPREACIKLQFRQELVCFQRELFSWKGEVDLEKGLYQDFWSIKDERMIKTRRFAQ